MTPSFLLSLLLITGYSSCTEAHSFYVLQQIAWSHCDIIFGHRHASCSSCSRSSVQPSQPGPLTGHDRTDTHTGNTTLALCTGRSPTNRRPSLLPPSPRATPSSPHASSLPLPDAPPKPPLTSCSQRRLRRATPSLSAPGAADTRTPAWASLPSAAPRRWPCLSRSCTRSQW